MFVSQMNKERKNKQMNEERGTKKQKERKGGCVAGNAVTTQLFYLEEQNKQPPHKYPSKLCHQLAWVSLHCLFYLFIVSLVFIPSCSVFISLCCLVARPPALLSSSFVECLHPLLPSVFLWRTTDRDDPLGSSWEYIEVFVI